MPKYDIRLDHGIGVESMDTLPQQALQFFPIRMQTDFLVLTVKSRLLNSVIQILIITWRSVTNPEMSNRSSAYIITPILRRPIWQSRQCFWIDRIILSTYKANNTGDKQPPCYGGVWNQNECKAQTEGKARDRAEERSGKGALWIPRKFLKI